MFLFKLFSGEDAGAQAEVSINSEISFGSSLDSDIYLETKSSFSGAFFITDHGTVQFRSLNDATLLLVHSNFVVENQEYKLPVYLAIGESRFAIGTESDLDEWVELPEVIEEEELAEKDSYDDPMRLLQEKPGGTTTKSADEVSGSAVEKGKSERKTLKNISWNKLHPALVGKSIYSFFSSKLIPLVVTLYNTNKAKFYALCAGIVVLTGMLFSLGFIFAHKEVVAIEVNTGQAIKKKFGELPESYVNVNLKGSGNGKYQITGMVLTDKNLQDLKLIMKLYQQDINYDVLTMHQVDTKIEAILLNYGMGNTKVSYDELSQTVLVSGIVNVNDGAISDMQLEVSSKLSSVTNIDFRIFTVDQIMQDVKGKLGNLVNILNIKNNLDKGELTVSGFLTEPQIESCKKGLLDIQNKYQGIITIHIDLKDSLASLPFKIYSIYLGNPAYIITSRGDSVYVGGKVADFTLVNLTRNKIVLANSKYTIEIPLDQLDYLNSKALGNNASGSDKGNSRTDLLREELVKLESSVQAEQYQLKRLQRYKEKLMDNETREFSEQEIANITADVEIKKKDIEYLKKTINE